MGVAVSRRPRYRASRDAGAATVWVLGLAVLLAASGGLVLVLGAVAAGRYRAAAAADQAALAATAAQARADPDPDPCRVAGRVSAAGGAALVGCTVRVDGVVDVTVRLPRVLPWPGTDLQVRSRAGPSG